jgi:hypothetical protein
MYFIGVSKGGTTSMIHILDQHPLIANIGNLKVGGSIGESHVFGSYNVKDVKHEESKRLHRNLGSKNITIILDRGIVSHYTPHYIIDPSIGNEICSVLSSEMTHCRKKRFFVMLREPTSRTISSWWYKSDCYKKNCPPLTSVFTYGMGKVRALDSCMQSRGSSISKQCVAFGAGNFTGRMARVLFDCPLSMLAPTELTSLYSSHFGKSMYAHQLIRWFQLFDPSQFYIMLLENFSKDPVGEMELLLKWLDLPAYGPDGYASPQELYGITQKKFNSHNIPHAIQKEKVDPYKKEISKFFQPSLKDLYSLLSAGLRPQIKHNQDITWNDMRSLVHDRNVKMADEVSQFGWHETRKRNTV